MTTTLFFVAAFCVVALLVYMARYSGRVRITRKRLIDAPLVDNIVPVSEADATDTLNIYNDGTVTSGTPSSGCESSNGSRPTSSRPSVTSCGRR